LTEDTNISYGLQPHIIHHTCGKKKSPLWGDLLKKKKNKLEKGAFRVGWGEGKGLKRYSA